MSRNSLLLATALVLFMFIYLTWVQQMHTVQSSDGSLLGHAASIGARGGLAAHFDELQIVKRFRARGVARGCSSTETHSAATTQSEARAGGTLMHFGYWEGWGNMIEKYIYVEAIGQVAGKSVSHFRGRCSSGNYNCHFTPNDFFDPVETFTFTPPEAAIAGNLPGLAHLSPVFHHAGYKCGSLEIVDSGIPANTNLTWMLVRRLLETGFCSRDDFVRERMHVSGPPEQIPKKEDIILVGFPYDMWNQKPLFFQNHTEADYSCLARSVFHKPKDFVIKAALPVLSKLGPNDLLVSIHVRLGDSALFAEAQTRNTGQVDDASSVFDNTGNSASWDKRTDFNHVQAAFEEADRIVSALRRGECGLMTAKGQKIKIFLASDTSAPIKLARQRWGDQLLVLDTEHFHSAGPQKLKPGSSLEVQTYTNMAAEWYLLALSDVSVRAEISSFSTTAYRLGLNTNTCPGFPMKMTPEPASNHRL